MNESAPTETSAARSRDVFIVGLSPVPGPDGESPVAASIGPWLRGVLQRLRARIGESPHRAPRASPIFAETTASAVGALEGKLKSASIEGALKQAEIEKAYAEARERNAVAARQEAETAKLRQEMAFERLERSLKLFAALGVPVNIVTLPDGRTAITVGEGLVAGLPPLEEGASAAAGPPGPAATTPERDEPTTTNDSDPR